MIEQLKLLPIKKIEEFKIPIALCLVGLVLIIGGFFTKSTSSPAQFPKESIVSNQKQIAVDISGAVKNPGVYKLNELARVEEAIIQAGGFSEEANFEHIAKNVNLAAKLSDGSKIYIPFKGENYISVQTGSNAGGVGAKININSSSQSELESLPGIGPVTASKIISSRPYNKVEDLLNQKIVSKKVFDGIKDSITIY